jgi:hypothetical protein
MNKKSIQLSLTDDTKYNRVSIGILLLTIAGFGAKAAANELWVGQNAVINLPGS